jgi:hypothetical protein
MFFLPVSYAVYRNFPGDALQNIVGEIDGGLNITLSTFREMA